MQDRQNRTLAPAANRLSAHSARSKASFIAGVLIGTFLLMAVSGLGCAVTGESFAPPSGTPTATRTPIPRPVIDYNATVLAATVQAKGGYIVTSTPEPSWPTITPTPFDQISFLATINAQFAQATQTAQAMATPTSTRTPPPPQFLPPAGGRAPGKP